MDNNRGPASCPKCGGIVHSTFDELPEKEIDNDDEELDDEEEADDDE